MDRRAWLLYHPECSTALAGRLFSRDEALILNAVLSGFPDTSREKIGCLYIFSAIMPPAAKSAPEGFADRLKIALNQRSARSLALEIGLSTSVLSDYSTGKTQPSVKYLVDISDALGVNIEWLATGRGPIWVDSSPPPSSRPQFAVFDTSALTIAMEQMDALEKKTGKKLGPKARASAIAGLYLALMEDRAAGQPDPEIE